VLHSHLHSLRLHLHLHLPLTEESSSDALQLTLILLPLRPLSIRHITGHPGEVLPVKGKAPLFIHLYPLRPATDALRHHELVSYTEASTSVQSLCASYGSTLRSIFA
jgi:hypothetical protein